MPENCGTSQAFCTAMLKMADRLRLFALFGRSTPENWGTCQAICIFVTHMMKLADSLRLGALHSRKLRNVSGFLHRRDENCRQSQAACAFWALHSRKLGNASGYLHFFVKLADSLRLFAFFVHSTPENCGTSQAI